MNKRQIVLFTLLIFVALLGFSQQNTQGSWMKEFNKDRITLSLLEQYHPKAAIDIGDGMNQSRNDIAATLVNLKSEIQGVANLNLIASQKGPQGNIMEIYKFQSIANDRAYYALIGWRLSDDIYLKEMEHIRGSDEFPKYDKAGIDESRNKWVELSNQHSPSGLVNQIYTKDAQYYNNGKLASGRSSIIERYQYMSSTNWSIELIPIHTTQIQKNLAFEIGNYISSGKGQYMLVWTMEEDGKWRVLFDFNF